MSPSARAANGSGEAVPANEPSLALVSASRELSHPSGELTTAQLVERTGWSPAWVKNHAGALGGRLVGGAYIFPPSAVQVAIERRTTTSEKIVLATPREPDVGRRSAAVLQRLEEGARAVSVAIELTEPLDFVLRVREQWLRAAAAEHQGIHRCGCGAPSDVATARCRPCFASSATLTEEERRTLANQPIPQAVRCSCGRVCDSGTCDACIADVTVVVEDGAIVVRAGARLLKTLPLTLLVPTSYTPPAPAAASPTAPAPAAVSEGTRALIEQAHRLIADACAPIDISKEDT